MSRHFRLSFKQVLRRLSSLGQHSCNVQNSCAKVWSPETLSDAVWSSNVFLKNFKTLIKAYGGKCISDGDFAVCRLILKPLSTWPDSQAWVIHYQHNDLYWQADKQYFKFVGIIRVTARKVLTHLLWGVWILQGPLDMPETHKTEQLVCETG